MKVKQDKSMNQKIKENKAYYGEIIGTWKESDLNCYVITGLQASRSNTIDTLVGRVVQVRLESGQFGSDTVLIRHANDTLTSHENQSYFRIPDKFKKYLDKCFDEAYLDDPINNPYSISGKYSETGFIIESKVPEGCSTPMRDIKASINNSISKFIKSK